MGDKSIHLSASLGIGRKPKDGKDGESVTILYTNVSYQVSDSPTKIPQSWEGSITNVKQTDAKPYLWTKTEVHYNVAGKDTITYSVSYKGKDGTNGTSFTPKGMATAYYHQADRNTFTEEGIYLVDIYTTASVEQKLYVITRKADGSISYTFAEIGDGYNVGGHLYVAQKPGWVDFGDIKGTDGKDGENGKDALDIVLSPAKLTFTADANGNPLITSDNNKSMLTVMRGKKDVSRGITDVAVTGMLCNATTSTVNDNRMIFIASISKQEVSVTTSEGTVKKYVPATSGSVNISFLLDGVRYTASLPFTVDVKTVLGGVYSDNEKFYTHYEEITNGLEDKINQVQDDTNDNLTQLNSRIEETASQIKLEVSQQPYAVRNLLPGSSFRRQGEGPYIDPQIRIERNTGKGGVSCLHIATQYGGSGEGGYLGAFWDSTYAPFAASGVPIPSDSVAGQNIPIQSDTDYTLSCWVKADNTDLTFCIEAFEMAAYNSTNRGTAHRQTFTVSQKDTWQLVEFTIHGKEITSPYLAVNFWCNAKTTKPLTDGTYPAVNAYICQPMLDAASQYSGWSLSPNDGDYQGGNLLDSTATLIPSDSSTSTVGQSTPLLQVADSAITLRSYEGVYSVAHVNNTTGSSIELLCWNVENVIQDNHDYILSFLAKGTGSITTYLYRDGTPRIYVESINGEQPQLSADGSVSIQVTSEWKRYWVHYRLRATAQYPNLPDKLLFRVMSGNDISICQPKLEDGARPTSYTERKTDLVDKASLKKAGIEITNDTVTLYGEKVKIKNNAGELSALFTGDKNYINNALIDAETITVDHLFARDKNGGTSVGHFGNYDIEAAESNSWLLDKCPLWIGASTANDAPFAVDKDGRIKALAGYIGNFNIEKYDDPTGYKFYSLKSSSRYDGYYTFPERDIYIGDAGISTTFGKLSQGKLITNVEIGGVMMKKDGGMSGAFISVTSDNTGGLKTYEMIGISLGLYPATGQTCTALYANNGDIILKTGKLVGGNRRPYRYMGSNDLDLNTSGDYISGMILKCNGSSDAALKLPTAASGAKAGDYFTMIKTGTGKVNVYGESYIPCRGGWKEGNGWTCSTRYEHVHFLFDGSTWYSECTLDS